MLKEYIDQYIWAKRINDEKAMCRLEKELEKLGMDYATLQMLVEEEMLSWIDRD